MQGNAVTLHGPYLYHAVRFQHGPLKMFVRACSPAFPRVSYRLHFARFLFHLSTCDLIIVSFINFVNPVFAKIVAFINFLCYYGLGKEVIMLLSDRIKEVRKLSGLTAEQFGARIGVSKAGISRMENGRNGTTDQTIMSICREFNVNEEWLRTGTGPMLDDSKPSILARLSEEKQLTPREQAIVSAFIDLPPQDRAAIMRYMDSLVEKLSQAPPDPQKKDPDTASSSGG